MNTHTSHLVLPVCPCTHTAAAVPQALLQQVDALGAADEQDVERVQQAEARAQERRRKAAAKEAAAAADLDGQGECGDMGEEAAAVAAAGERGTQAQGGKRKAADRKRKAAG